MDPGNCRKSWCKNRIGTPKFGENLDAQIEPNNPVEKYAVYIRKSGKVVGHLKKGATDRFAKIIFIFRKGDPYLKEKAVTSGRRCNLDDGESLQVPCKLKFVGHWKFTDDELIRWTYQTEKNLN